MLQRPVVGHQAALISLPVGLSNNPLHERSALCTRRRGCFHPGTVSCVVEGLLGSGDGVWVGAVIGGQVGLNFLAVIIVVRKGIIDHCQ